uniref:Major facilitator superfamily MFS_1 n=1 Tax=Caulobacter sp. (strain K31) TaxID=366602 RepID=B0T5L5_CAUSK
MDPLRPAKSKASKLSSLPVEHRRILYLVGAALLVNHFDLGIFSLALPQIQAELKIPESQLGLVVGLLRLGVLAAFLLGFAADLVGRRTILMVTIVGTTIGTLLTAFVQNQWQFFGLQVLVRCFSYAEEMVCFVMIVETVSADRRGWAMGRLSALGALGTGIAAMLYSHVKDLPHGWRDLYLIGGLGLILLVLARQGLKESERFETLKAARKGVSTTLANRLSPMLALVRENPGRFLALIAVTVPYTLGMAAGIAFVSKHLQETHHISPAKVAILYIVAGAISFWGYVFAGRLADIIGRRFMLMISMPGAALLYAALYLATDPWVAMGVWIPGLFLMFSSEMTLSMLGSELFPTRYRATAASARVVIMVFAGMIGLAAESWVYGMTGSLPQAVVILLCLTPLSLLALFFVPETARKELEAIGPDIAATLDI